MKPGYVNVPIDPLDCLGEMKTEDILDYLIEKEGRTKLELMLKDSDIPENRSDNPMFQLYMLKHILQPKGCVLPGELKKIIDDFIDFNVIKTIC